MLLLHICQFNGTPELHYLISLHITGNSIYCEKVKNEFQWSSYLPLNNQYIKERFYREDTICFMYWYRAK